MLTKQTSPPDFVVDSEKNEVYIWLVIDYNWITLLFITSLFRRVTAEGYIKSGSHTPLIFGANIIDDKTELVSFFEEGRRQRAEGRGQRAEGSV